MKFAYVDESGSHAEDDVFVMAGLLFDAHRLRKYTATFDRMIAEFLATHPSAPEELKTKAITGGTHGWSKVDPTERKQLVTDVCDLATQCATVFAIGFSFKKFEEAINAGYGHTFGKSYWIGAAMFVAALVQKNAGS